MWIASFNSAAALSRSRALPVTQSLNFPRKPQNNVQLAPHRRRRSGLGAGRTRRMDLDGDRLSSAARRRRRWILVDSLRRARLEALPAAASTTSSAADHPAAAAPRFCSHVLLALAAVIALGQILAWLFAKIHQPPVIGEVVAGILLGPSLIGREWSAAILPPAAESYLGLVAQLGAILYMFIVGLEMNASRLRHRAHATLSIAHASMLVPFLLGSLLALPSTRDL